MVKKFLVFLKKGIKGYNPPEYYRTLSSKSDALKFRDEFNNPPIISPVCNLSMDNNMGRVVVTIKEPNQRETMHVILIDVTETDKAQKYPLTRYFYVGVIDRINNISATQVEISYTIDWYTSYALNYWNTVNAPNNSKSIPSLTASTVLYRRLSNGEFDYKDEGFIGAKVTSRLIMLRCTADNDTFYFEDKDGNKHTYTRYEGNFFNNRPSPIDPPAEYIVYHDSVHNMTINCIYVGDFLNFNDVDDLKRFLGYFGLTFDSNSPPSPDGFMFRGYLPIPSSIAIRGLVCVSKVPTGIIGGTDGVFAVSNSAGYLNRHPKNIFSAGGPIYLFADELVKCTEYNKVRIETGDGAIIYDIPLGKTLSGTCTKDDKGKVVENDNIIKLNMYMSASLTSPVITLRIENDSWKQSSSTITLPIYNRPYFIDSYQVYQAQERVYQMSMLGLQSQNELVSGIIGGVNQGAMISAFSRTGARTGKQAMDKGIIGGGIGIAGAFANFAYQTLWANKQATEITDRYNRCKPDVLAQDGFLDSDLLLYNSGIRCYTYDADTIANIKAYQDRFGYQTQKVENNVDLKAFIGYVQADVIFGIEERKEGNSTEILGLRTEVEQYIKDMFSYGVWFTHITS